MMKRDQELGKKNTTEDNVSYKLSHFSFKFRSSKENGKLCIVDLKVKRIVISTIELYPLNLFKLFDIEKL